MQKAKLGLWTPWAQVLCYECHGFKFPRTATDDNGGFKTIEITLSEFEQKRCSTELRLEEDKRITFCDRCGQAIQTYDSVAYEHNMVKSLRELGIDAYMEQTGGMNSACCVYKQFMGPLEKDTYPPYYLATYNFDGDNMWYIGSYNEFGDWDQDNAQTENTSFDNEKDVINWFLDNDNAKRIVGDTNDKK